MFYSFTHKSSSETKVIQAVDVAAARSCLPDSWVFGTYVLEITVGDPRRSYWMQNRRYYP